MNIFRFSPQTVQQNQSIAQQGIGTGPSNCGVPTDGSLSGKMGRSFQSLLVISKQRVRM